MNRSGRSFLVVVSLLAATSSGCAKRSSPSETSTSQLPAATQPAESGANVRAYIDPVTGQLREPTREELAAEAAEAAKKEAASGALNKPTELKEVQLPSGAVAIELGDSAQHPLKACAQPNGDIKMDHECEPQSAPKK